VRKRVRSSRVRLLGSMEGSLCLTLEVPMRLLKRRVMRKMRKVVPKCHTRLARSTTLRLGLRLSVEVALRTWRCTVLQVWPKGRNAGYIQREWERRAQ